tara:strand:+ start:356 stop:652 length:297 start_codon:yes stop_codon:yes gene_type:complete
MVFKKNKEFIDPRYFMDEKTNIIKEEVEKPLEVSEGHYHDMGDEHELYNLLDPYNFEKMTDAELVDAMYKDGMEELVVFDGEGDLVDRKKIIAALKNV